LAAREERNPRNRRRISTQEALRGGVGHLVLVADDKGLLAMDESTPTCKEGMILKPNMVLSGLMCPKQEAVVPRRC